MNLLITVPTKLSKVKLRNAYLRNANLRGALLMGADLENAVLLDSDLEDATLYRANLNGANLTRTKFQGADLSYSLLINIRTYNNTTRNGQKYNFTCQGADFTNAVIDDIELVEYLKRNNGKNVPNVITDENNLMKNLESIQVNLNKEEIDVEVEYAKNKWRNII